MRWTVFSLFALALPLSPAAAQDSAYSDLDLDACEVTATFEEGSGADMTCPDYKGVDVFVSEGDLRFDVDFGTRNDTFDTFGPFNMPGETIEWRLRGGEPFAAILRFHLDVANEEGTTDRGQVLAVFKIAEGGKAGCPVAYVDALLNSDANILARQAADEAAAAFDCARDRPAYVGQTGPLSGDATAATVE